MTAPNDPAFYGPEIPARGNFYGLSKREYIATHCLQGLLAATDCYGDLDYHDLATNAVLQADALISALNEPEQ